jgi:hypothetical protein
LVLLNSTLSCDILLKEIVGTLLLVELSANEVISKIAKFLY